MRHAPGRVRRHELHVLRDVRDLGPAPASARDLLAHPGASQQWPPRFKDAHDMQGMPEPASGPAPLAHLERSPRRLP